MVKNLYFTGLRSTSDMLMFSSSPFYLILQGEIQKVKCNMFLVRFSSNFSAFIGYNNGCKPLFKSLHIENGLAGQCNR